MRFHLHKNYIELKSDTLLWYWSKLTGTDGKAKAGAFFPFIITTSKIEPALREAFINHELIHFAQQKELLLVGGWLLWLCE